MTRRRPDRLTGNPLVDGAVHAVKEMGGKALRRAVESVMEDGQQAVEELRDEILDARSRVEDGPLYDPDIRVRQVRPDTEDDMNDRAERRRRREERDGGREGEHEDPPPSGDVAELAELIDLRDAEVFIRHGWTILADLSKSGSFSKDTVKDLESILDEISEAVEEREGSDPE